MSTIQTTHPAVLNADSMAIIGRTLHDLRGIRHGDGDGGAAPAAPAAPAPAAPAAPATPAAPAPATDPKPGSGQAPVDGVKFDDLDPTTQAYVRGLREEARVNREAAETATAAQTAAQEQRDKVLAAMGLGGDGKPLPKDPAELESALNTVTQTAAEQARENLLLRVAPSLSANADRLLDSRAFVNQLSALKADDREGITALVTQTIANDPSMKTAPPAAAASGGATHTGTAPITQRVPLKDAIGAAYAAKR